MSDTIIKLSANPAGFGSVPDELEPAMFESPLPVQHSHSWFEDDNIGLYVGVWDTTTMTETAGPYTCEEFMWVLEGEVGIRNNRTGAVDTVRAGEAFVIPRGYDCQWQQNGYLRKFYLIYESPDLPVPSAPAVEGIVKPRLVAGANISAGPVSREIYLDGSGLFSVGSWQASDFQTAVGPRSYHQFAYVVEGDLVVEDGEERHSFASGDALFIPRGVATRWRVERGAGLLWVKVRV